jgi:hypothetical protein
VEKYCTAGQAANDDITRLKYIFACWMTKAINTHSEYVLLLFHGNSGYANAPQCYVMLIFPAL